MKRVLKRLDSVHEKLLRTVTPLDSKTFTQRPSENEWSVGDIVQHLSLVEERVLHDLEKAVRRDPQRVGVLKRLLPTSIVSSRMLKVKSPKAVTPTAVTEKETTIEALESARRKLKAFCDLHDVKRFRRLTFNHPFLGKIDGVATISFVSYHEQRHYKQIREVLKKIG
ncbi:MAG TPA: DinB family protein [Pyrinomonadaceae bacterium]|nr:DinB family protein [Pyrinomonadaceae bacterium]